MQTLFNRSFEIVGHYFKIVLGVAIEFGQRQIQLDPNYNHSAEHHVPNMNKHSIFENCIGAIDGMHVTTVLPRYEQVNFV